MYRSSTSTLSIPLLLISILLDVFLILPLLILALPWLAFKVFAEGRGVGDLRQRFGMWQISLPVGPRIWVHAASVGEVQAAKPLLAELKRVHPGKEFVLTTMTTGAHDLARKLIPDVDVRLLPIDMGHFMFSMIRKMRPSALILVELEYWPQMLLACQAYSIPVLVVNGRISDRGLKSWQSWKPILGWMSRVPQRVLARSDEDADRFIQIGTPAERVSVGGNLKYDVSDSGMIKAKRHSEEGFTWIAGCTHPGEEQLAVEVHQKLQRDFPESRCIIAPRHIERSSEIFQFVEESGFTPVFWSQSAGSFASEEILVVDQLGVLKEAYSTAEAAFVGGSLVDRGGHNFLEAVLSGCWTCHGPHIDNFRDMAELLQPWNGVDLVADRDELLNWLRQRASARNSDKERQAVVQSLMEGLGGISRSCVAEMNPWLE